jgi:hypothetical protein
VSDIRFLKELEAEFDRVSKLNAAAPQRRPRRHWPRVLELGAGAVGVGISVLIVVAVLAVFLGVHSRGRAGGEAIPDRAQAQLLYAPVVAFNRSTTPAQRAQIHAASAALGSRINTCQRPYAKQLYGGLRVNTRRYQAIRFYQLGLTLETVQAAEAVAMPEIAAAQRSWATMQLGNPTVQTTARALAAEIEASLSAPKLNGCAFLHQLASHNFSLAWAQRTPYATTTNNFIRETDKPSAGVSLGYRYILLQKKLLTSNQWGGIVNFPGILG